MELDPEDIPFDITPPPQSKGIEKMRDYFENLKKDERFRKRVEDIREEAKIYNLNRGENEPFHRTSRYDELVAFLCFDFGLSIESWRLNIYLIIFYDAWDNLLLEELEDDMCVIKSHDFERSRANVYSELENSAYEQTYPLYIAINAYASREDILNFIEKNYTKNIEPVLKQHRIDSVKLGKLRKRSKSLDERDMFILENSHLSAKNLARLVREKFGVVTGYDNIAKIRQKYNKSRSEKTEN